ncbi:MULTISPECIES: putative metalloprotease CJM1_0395 family protein [unclassified Guyparkeria]|uniref:putative metalloprotease CJM1_0395 family protein n=1 Tax=unclassified Guyparkeria TaxID=2626246 RepID=UPI0007337B06|nr:MULTISPECIES: putative metalloprotease CJM1_0395 family protein [unclassified Guyparkeria]KTG15893.1 hypothetical protein AUR63_06135 [Guyparkeria sp. XI15]OAE84643.1 hypothetical protein AWR35_06145 [Guyparkeria sp. WRN-7]
MSLIASPLASLPPASYPMQAGTTLPPNAGSAAIAPPRPGDASETASKNNQNGGHGVGNRDGRGSAEEQRMLAELKARDQEVRNHENAHRAAAGDLVRGGSYQYQQGPDGKRYAVGGDVQIDTSPVPDDPAATAEKMQRVIAAALAPAEPSATDLAVAAEAAAERNRARAEARQEGSETGATVGPSDDQATSAYQQIADQTQSDSIGLRLEA